MNGLKLHSMLGEIQIIGPNNFKLLSDMTKVSQVQGGSVLQYDILESFTTNWDKDNPFSVNDTHKRHTKNLTHFNFRTKFSEEARIITFTELLKNEIINLVNTNTERVLENSILVLKDIHTLTNKIAQHSGSPNQLLFFTWILSKYRSISILFDSHDLTFYTDKEFTKGALVFPNAKKLALAYHNSGEYKIMDEMMSQQMYHHQPYSNTSSLRTQQQMAIFQNEMAIFQNDMNGTTYLSQMLAYQEYKDRAKALKMSLPIMEDYTRNW